MNIKEIFGGVKKEEKEKTPVSPFTSPKEKVLREGEFSLRTNLGGGINETDFVRIEGDGSGVLKKVREKGCANRERAAYLIDRFLGFNFVPPTVLKGEREVLQEFVEDAETADTYGKRAKKETGVSRLPIPKDQILKLHVFDFIIRNVDRHKGNYLIKDDKIFAIDHEFSLSESKFGESSGIVEYQLERIVEMVGQGERISGDIVASLKKFYSWPEGQELLAALLGELIDKEIVKEFIKQLLEFIEAITEEGGLDGPKILELIKQR